MFPVSCMVNCLGDQSQVVKEHMPDEAATVFEKCINEKALVLSGKVKPVRLDNPVRPLCFTSFSEQSFSSADSPFTQSVLAQLIVFNLTRSIAL